MTHTRTLSNCLRVVVGNAQRCVMYVIAFVPVPGPKRSSNVATSPSFASCASSSGCGIGRSVGTAERERVVGYEGLGGGGRATLSASAMRGDGRSVPSPLPSVIPVEDAEGDGAGDDVHSPIKCSQTALSHLTKLRSTFDSASKSSEGDPGSQRTGPAE